MEDAGLQESSMSIKSSSSWQLPNTLPISCYVNCTWLKPCQPNLLVLGKPTLILPAPSARYLKAQSRYIQTYIKHSAQKSNKLGISCRRKTPTLTLCCILTTYLSFHLQIHPFPPLPPSFSPRIPLVSAMACEVLLAATTHGVCLAFSSQDGFSSLIENAQKVVDGVSGSLCCFLRERSFCC